MSEIICTKCGIPLKEEPTRFTYLGHELHDNVPRCPKCGQIYLSEEMVNGKVNSVEAGIEDK